MHGGARLRHEYAIANKTSISTLRLRMTFAKWPESIRERRRIEGERDAIMEQTRAADRGGARCGTRA